MVIDAWASPINTVAADGQSKENGDLRSYRTPTEDLIIFTKLKDSSMVFIF